MADKELKKTEEKPSTSLTDKAATAEKTHKRSQSPAALSAQLVLKTKSQVGRLKSLSNLQSQLPTHAHSTSFNELKLIAEQVEQIHSVFCKEHEYLETVWPSEFLNHDYFETEVAAEEQQLVWSIKIMLNRLKEDVEAITSTRPTASSSSST